MSQLQITCLGDFQVAVADVPLTAFQTEKVQALLIYLAVEGQPHQRGELAQLLWPGYRAESANNSLRQTLHRLRQLLHDATSDPPWLLITRQTVQFNPAASILVDATDFSTLLTECAAHAHAQLVQCQPCCVRLRLAVDLYGGDFLAGFTIADSDPFEEWRRITQEQLHLQCLDALTYLADAAEAAGDDEQALQDSRRQLGMEPWLEAAHRRVMRILARRGQRAAANAQYLRCCQVLAEELGIAPDQETTTLYEQIQTGAFDKVTKPQGVWVATGASLVSSPDPPVISAHNLPPVSTPLVGRTQALANIVSQLHLPGVRLLTLGGPGGIGKTRLALEVGRELLTAFADGVFFVPLAAIRTPSALAPAIATAIGLTLQGEPRMALLQALHPKQMLLILDNFEHLLVDGADGAGLVADLLNMAPAVQIVVTSRQRLKLRNERLYHVQALVFAPNTTLTEATSSSAVRLFVQCAQRVQVDFQVTEANLAAVLRICGLVQGIPLGLELAAAWCDVLSLDEIVHEIEQSLDFLAVDHPDLPERQRSMRAVFAWSWRLLSEEEARVLHRLSVFRGGFTRQSAETICAASLRGLTGLVNKSLLWHVLVADDAATTGTGRYELHELLRQFAQEQLNVSPEEWAEVATRHSEFYLAFMAECGQRLLHNEPRQAMMAIQVELDNVRQAWTWAVHQCAAELLDRSAYGLWQFYLLAGRSAEGVQVFRQAATAIQDVFEEEEAGFTAGRQSHVLSKLWALAAHLLSTYGDFDAAIEAAQRAIALASAGSPAVSHECEALGHLAWGQALYYQSQFGEAQIHNEQALQIALAAQREMAPDEVWPEIEVLARLFLNAIARENGDYVLAQSHLTACLQLCRRLGKVRGEIHAQLNLGWTYWLLREVRSARQAYEQALPLTTALHYRWGEATAYLELAQVVRHLGEYSSALALCQQSLAIFVEINERLKQVEALGNLVELYGCLGSFERAAGYQAQLLAVLRQFNVPDAERLALVASTIFAHCQDDNEQAFVYAQQLWQLLQPTNSRFYQAEALTLLGQTQAALQMPDAAVDSYMQALALYKLLGQVHQATEAQAGLAAIALAEGDLARAMYLVEGILATLEQHPSAGLYEPFGVYLTCYRALIATHDPRARSILQTAHDLLQTHATYIHDEELRRSFLQNVPVHHQLVVAYEGAPKSNQGLPLFFTPFVGRQDEMAEIIAHLHQPEVRLVTLVGAGGMGKTRLAVEAAQNIEALSFPDGCFFVPLAGLSDPTGLASAICAGLGLTTHGGDLRRTLFQGLSDQRLLLVLDNIEHLLPAAQSSLPETQRRAAVMLIAELLHHAPGVKILVTSRQRLDLSSEHLFPVQGLAFSMASDDHSASAAVRLFVQSAQRLQPHYQLNRAEVATLLDICQVVQGMPLALEMAAAWTDQLSLAEIAGEINKNIDFLAVEWHDVPERQRSMHAVFDWSWNLLSPAEQQVLRKLSIFRGGFTQEAAEQIAGASLRSLNSLVHKSLIRRIVTGSSMAGRYELHELLRQFASEQLDASPAERADLAARHGKFYLAFVAAREYRLARHEPRQATEEVRVELDNIRHAWHWAAVQPDITVLDGAAFGWWQFCLLAGLTLEGEQTFGLAAAHVRTRLEQIDEQDPLHQQTQRLLSKLLAIHANYLFAQGKDEWMAMQAREAISLGEASGGLEGETFGYFVLGRALQELQQHASSRAMWEKTIQLAHDYQTRQPFSELLREVECMTHSWLRGALLFFGEYLDAKACSSRALRICRSLGKVRGEMTCLTDLAEINSQLNDYAAACQGYEQALTIARTLGYPLGIASTQWRLGELQRIKGEYRQAQVLLEQAATTAYKSGIFYDEAWALAALLRLHCQVGNHEGAYTCHLQLQQRMVERELTLDCQAQGLLAFAVHALFTQDYQQALIDAQQGWQLAEQSTPSTYRADAAVILGHACAAAQQWTDAAQAYQQAIATYRQLGNGPLLVEPQAGLAQVALAQGHDAQALALVESILPVLAERPYGRVHTPFFAYLVCCRVLLTTHDPAATVVLQSAQRLLQSYAALIGDDAAQRSFLENVAAHRELSQITVDGSE